MTVVDLDEVHGNSRPFKFVVELLRLRDGHRGVLRAMHDEKWRIRFRHMEDGRGATPHFGQFGEVAAKEVCEHGISVGIAVGKEIAGPADVYHGLHTTGVLGQSELSRVSSIPSSAASCAPA